MYVIKHQDGGYIRMTSNGSWERTAKLINASPARSPDSLKI